MIHLLIGLLLLCAASPAAFAQTSEPEKFKWYLGDFRFTNVEHWSREFNNTRGTSFGGNFSLRTPERKSLSAFATYSIANNFGLDPKNPADRNSLAPWYNVSVLSELFAKYQTGALHVRGGAMRVDTPFTVPSDAFMIPISYKGGEVGWKLSEDGQSQALAGILTEIKIRESDEFVNTGEYLLGRYAAANRPPRNVAFLGARHRKDAVAAQAFAYSFDDIMYLAYLDFMYTKKSTEDLAFYGALQAGKEEQSGDKLLGGVDSQILGVRLGAKWRTSDFSIAANHVPESSGFRGGTWLEPFTFSTSPVYTNNMMLSLGNKLPGSAYKAMWLKKFAESWHGKLSYTNLNLMNPLGTAGGVWQSEWDFDLGYKFAGRWKGLSILNRLAYLDGAQRADRINAWRFHITYSY